MYLLNPMRYIALLLLLIAQPAFAAVKIINLDDIPHIVTIINGGEHSDIKILPNQSYTTYGPMVDIGLKGEKKKLRADPFGEYVIWGDGKLLLQRLHEQNNRR